MNNTFFKYTFIQDVFSIGKTINIIRTKLMAVVLENRKLISNCMFFEPLSIYIFLLSSRARTVDEFLRQKMNTRPTVIKRCKVLRTSYLTIRRTSLKCSSINMHMDDHDTESHSLGRRKQFITHLLFRFTHLTHMNYNV